MNDLDLVERFRAETPEPDDLWLRQLRTRITSDTRGADPRRTGRRRRRAIVLAAAAFVMAAMIVVGSSVLPEDSPTAPDPAVADVLRRFSRIAVNAPAQDPPGPGQYVYSKTESLATQLFLPGPGLEPFAYQVSLVDQRWEGVDGSLREVLEIGQPTFLSPKDRAAFEAFLGTEAATRWGGFDWGKSYDDRYGPGELSGLPDPRSLPTDPSELLRLLEGREIFGGPRGDWETFELAADILHLGYVPPDLRSAVFQVMSALPGTELGGPTRDQLGRAGVPIAYTHNGIRQEIVFDRESGDVLEHRETSVTDHPDVGLGAPHEINTACCTELLWPGKEAGTIMFSAVYVSYGEVVDSIEDVPDDPA